MWLDIDWAKNHPSVGAILDGSFTSLQGWCSRRILDPQSANFAIIQVLGDRIGIHCARQTLSDLFNIYSMNSACVSNSPIF